MKTITAVLSMFLIAGLGACNTVEGAGEDVEASGQAIGETARDVERELSE